jgi:hypothetical protein
LPLRKCFYFFRGKKVIAGAAFLRVCRVNIPDKLVVFLTVYHAIPGLPHVPGNLLKLVSALAAGHGKIRGCPQVTAGPIAAFLLSAFRGKAASGIVLTVIGFGLREIEGAAARGAY